MSTATHTKGPWEVSYSGNEILAKENHKKGNGQFTMVARLANPDENFDNEENAKLIAAAPLMLDTLRAIVTMSQRHDPATGYYKSVDPYELWKIAFNAMTKAQGIGLSNPNPPLPTA